MLGGSAGRLVLRGSRQTVRQLVILASDSQPVCPLKRCRGTRGKATLAAIPRPVSLEADAILPSHSLSSDNDLLRCHQAPISISIEDDIKVCARKLPTRVSLRTLVDVGLGRRPWLSSIRDAQSIRDALAALQERLHLAPGIKIDSRQESCMRMGVFLHQELPIRFARGANQLDSLDLVQDIHSIQQVRSWYAQSFEDIRMAAVPDTLEAERDFVRILERIRDRHAEELVYMARGIYELRQRLHQAGHDDYMGEHSMVHRYLDLFYVKRIALRILIGHYLALHHEDRQDYVGIVCMKTPVTNVIEVAASDASWICRKKYGMAPEIMILGEEGLSFPYVPEHLYYILMELIKNSLRAVVESNPALDSEDLPPIKIVVNKDYSLTEGSQVIIKVSDEGGGVPQEALERIWCYLFTTAEPSVQAAIMGDMQNDGPGGTGRYGMNRAVPLAGLGYGLPMSRAYAKYFGGDIEMLNRPGQGLDVIVRLSRLGDKKEPLV